MRLGIFGGSFDPIHHGHLILARAAREQLGLDQVLLIPANRSPHKPGAKSATGHDRWAMLQLAIDGEPGLTASDLELQRPPPSYTLDTLRQLRDQHPEAELVLLIGADNVEKFDTWHEPAAIQQLATLAVLERASGAPAHPWPVVRRLVEISSTDLRDRVASGRSIRYLTPDRVCDYIRQHGLYRNE
jgi:nicotinate-nucleotide adenylyltransferase